MEPVRCEVSPSLWHVGRCTCAELEEEEHDDEDVAAPIVEA